MSLSDEILTVDTPENVNVDYHIAGIGSRFLAALVDSAIIVLLQILTISIGALAVYYVGQEKKSLLSLTQQNLVWVMAITGLIGFMFLWGYYILFEMVWNGQSPGKRLAKLRVICVDGRPVTLSESLIRNLVRLVDFMPVLYGVGVVAMFIHSQSRRLGDLAAGTLVVHDREKTVSLASLEIPDAPGLTLPETDFSPLDLPLERLTRSDFLLVENFLRRQEGLENAEILGAHLLKYLWPKMGLSPEELPRQNVVEILTAIYKRK